MAACYVTMLACQCQQNYHLVYEKCKSSGHFDLQVALKSVLNLILINADVPRALHVCVAYITDKTTSAKPFYFKVTTHFR